MTGGDGTGIGVWDIGDLDKVMMLRRVRGEGVERIRTGVAGRWKGKVWVVGCEEKRYEEEKSKKGKDKDKKK